MRQLTSLVTVCCLALLAACGGGGGSGGGGSGDNGGSAEPPRMVASFTPGAETMVVVDEAVGPSGATITIPQGSPLEGVVIDIPAGALSSPELLDIAYNDGVLTTVDGSAGPVMDLTFDNTTDFEFPLRITVPMAGTEYPVPYYIDENGDLHVAQISAVDETNHTVTFDTYHASLFTWIMTVLGLGDTQSYDTNFDVGEDGFQIDNRGSVYNREGECFGMSSFSLWYYENAKSTQGDFYPRFTDVIGVDSGGQNILGQNVIATRAFISIAQQWTSYYAPLVQRENRLNDEYNFSVIRNALMNTGNPVLIYLAQSSGVAAHSVLATGYSGGELSIYDVNYHNSERTINYSTTNRSFAQYAGYDRIMYNGDGSLRLTEGYQSILSDAEGDFQNSADATIEVTSHISGQSVTTPTITLSGTISSSQVLVDTLTVLVGSTEFTANVDTNGNFSTILTLESGTNHLQFVTKGNNAQGNKIEVPNTLAANDFTLVADVPESVILVTVTWDTNDTDVDTYVIDPTGDFSSYYHRVTADGGFLDVDVVSGYGPEHWLLTTENTVRYGEPYRVRLHYYSDHGNGPTNYTVTIKLYDGPDAVTTSYRGNLAVSSPSNNQPGDVGADWVDIATITPVQGASRQSTVARQSVPIAAAAPGQPVDIRVPIASSWDRQEAKVD